MSRWNLVVLTALVAILALHYSAIPRTLWEYDEQLYTAAVERYDPGQHRPPPPGAPVYIGFAKIIKFAIGDPFDALRVTSALAVAAGFLLWMLAFSAMTDARTGVVAAFLLYACPSVLMSGTLPQADSGALALMGAAAWACARGNPWLIAIFCAACVGWRPQFSIAVVPMFVVAVLLLKTWRARFIAVAAFGVACLAWFVPLVLTLGGPKPYWEWLSKQAAYYAYHDADLSRSGYTKAQIALRFLAHPWGPKFLSIPIWSAAALAAAFNWRRAKAATGVAALQISSACYLAFALATMDPADAVRYTIPALPAVALLAASTITRFRVDFLVLLYAAGAYWYAYPILHTRATTPAPPAAAADWIRANAPSNAVILFDAPLGPHAGWLLRDYESIKVDAGLAKYGGDVNVPLLLLADGERGDAQGVTFRWPDTDAYRKLTRQHYGAVSVIPIRPEERFRVLEGISSPERTRDGQAWRWVGARGVLELPAAGATRVRLTFRAPPEYPLDANSVRVSVPGHDTFVVVRRGESEEVEVPLPRGAVRVVLTPERTFIPANIEGANNRDKRTLSVMLTRVEQLVPAALPPAPAAADR